VNVWTGCGAPSPAAPRSFRQACSPEVYEELLRLNSLDRELVDRARGGGAAPLPAGAGGGTARPVQREQRRAQEPAGFLTTARRLRQTRSLLAATKRKRAENAIRRGLLRNSLLHFLLRGAYQGRQPHPCSDPPSIFGNIPTWQRRRQPAVHYLKHGAAELRQPHPLFDPGFYLDRNPTFASPA